MAQVDTVLKDFILNVLSEEEFQKLAEKDGNQLYFTDLIEYYTKEEARALMTLFRGQFANWESVPTSIANYASDFAGSKTPTQNNFMVVRDASGYAVGAYDILSHVESTGTQYINLGIIPTVGMKYVASFQASNSTTGTIFGTDGCDVHVYQGDKNPVTEINIGTSTLNTIGVSSGFDVNYELTVKANGVVSKASNITLSNPYSGELPTTEMYLLAKNTADNATNFSACIVKRFKVYEGETLLMDLVPARRVLDGAIGFVDIITNIFYENLGADPLIAGNVVSGNETPTDTNGSWLFIYNGKWNDNGKSGWTPAFALGGNGGGSGDGYSKAEIDNKIRVINESIDAQADAITKTRDDMDNADGELQTQITAQASAIAGKAKDSDVVHKTGDETISGVKTFTALSLKISNAAGTGGTGLNILDSNNKGQTYINQYYTNGRYYSRLENRNIAAGKTAYVEVVMNDDGATEFKSYNVDNMYAPTPVASSNGTNVATTAWVRDLFETLYPVGSLYITSTNTKTCPLASIVKKSDGSNSTWALVSSGRALWTGTGSNGNTTIAAGLPNITGDIGAFQASSVWNKTSGAFAWKEWEKSTYGGANNAEGSVGASFDASRSNSIYGNSTTVQPPAYVVNVWRRTA